MERRQLSSEVCAFDGSVSRARGRTRVICAGTALSDSSRRRFSQLEKLLKSFVCETEALPSSRPITARDQDMHASYCGQQSPDKVEGVAPEYPLSVEDRVKLSYHADGFAQLSDESSEQI